MEGPTPQQQSASATARFALCTSQCGATTFGTTGAGEDCCNSVVPRCWSPRNYMDRKLRFQLLFGSTQMVGFVAKLTILHIIYIYMYRERERDLYSTYASEASFFSQCLVQSESCRSREGHTLNSFQTLTLTSLTPWGEQRGNCNVYSMTLPPCCSCAW